MYKVFPITGHIRHPISCLSVYLPASRPVMLHVGILPNESRSKNFIHPIHGARSVRGVVSKLSTDLPTNWGIDSRLLQ
jgi:hypothetical protein